MEKFRELGADLRVCDTTELAYMGDAVYEVYIRKYVLEHFRAKINEVNRKVIDFVRADGQAKAAKFMLSEGFLSETEESLYKRARNHTNTNHPRGTSPMTYKMATGFEAVVGYLYLTGDDVRLAEFIEKTVEILGGRDE